MKTENNQLKSAGLLTTQNPGTGKITREVVEGFISHGRHLKSLYLLELFKSLGRWSKAVLFLVIGWPGTTFDQVRGTAGKITVQGKGEVCRNRH